MWMHTALVTTLLHTHTHIHTPSLSPSLPLSLSPLHTHATLFPPHTQVQAVILIYARALTGHGELQGATGTGTAENGVDGVTGAGAEGISGNEFRNESLIGVGGVLREEQVRSLNGLFRQLADYITRQNALIRHLHKEIKTYHTDHNVAVAPLAACIAQVTK